MARVTVEDCVIRVPNRFDLVMMAAQRARQISAGGVLTIDRDNDKNPVVALREIADETVATTDLHNALVESMQRHIEVDEPEEDPMDFDMADTVVESAAGAAAADDDSDDDAAADEDDGTPAILYEDVDTAN